MRLICLNTWGGRAFEALAALVLQHRDTTDVFCFQEIPRGHDEDHPLGIHQARSVRSGLLDDLRALLPDFSDQYALLERRVDGAPGAQEIGLSIFTRRSIPVLDAGQTPMMPVPLERTFSGPGWESVGMRPLQYCRLRFGDQDVWIANLHGTPDPSHKLDTEERLAQTQGILDWLGTLHGEVILVGDFNLLPDTESIGLLGRRLRSLIHEYAIPTTRSRLNPYRGTPREQKHADYAFVSAGISVDGFEVPDVAVSDHLPLILTCTLVTQGAPDRGGTFSRSDGRGVGSPWWAASDPNRVPGSRPR